MSLTSPDRDHSSHGKLKATGYVGYLSEYWIPAFLIVISLASRLFRLDFPRVVVFDELFYSRFVHLYTNGIFFFDSNPPFAKQLIAAAAHSAGYGKQNETFEKIGDPYSEDTPVFILRLIPALCGSFLVPLAYFLILELGYSQWIASLTAACFLFDNALVSGSRFVMTDSINLLILFLAAFCVLKFVKKSPSSLNSVALGLLSGLFMGLAISTKFLSFPTLLWLSWIIARNYWKTISDLRISVGKLFRYLGFCIFIVFVIPVGIYLATFFVHLTMLKKAGPYDSVMSSKFQASLEGGLAAITNGQPYNVAYGSQITLRNNAGIKDTACWLHSHKEVYPVFYADKRGSSHQQQVTCYAFKDVNNWWIVKNPNKTSMEVETPAEFVKDGSVVQLVHGITGRLLNSHDVAAPLTPECQEVSAYIDYNISMPAEDLWQVRIINQEPDDRIWHTIQTEVQLVHLSSSTSLSLSGQQLPDWGLNQFEVVSSGIHDKFTLSVWNVEEHRYTRPYSDVEEWEAALARSEFLPDGPVKLTFWKKFLELQSSMLGLARDTVEEHVYGSKPIDWVLNDNGVAFWAQRGTNRQIYQVGNNVIWQTGAICLLISTCALILIFVVRLRFYKALPVDKQQWNRLLFSAEICLGGFLINWLPYFFTDRTLFFHHYFPALGFKLLCLGCAFGEVIDGCRSKILRNTLISLLAVWISCAAYAFYRFIPLTYGMIDLPASAIRELEWRESWNFIIRN